MFLENLFGKLQEHEMELMRQSICVFSHTKKNKKENKIKITKRGKNVINIAQFFITLHCGIQNLIYFISGRSLHVHALQNSCLTSGYESIDFSLYTYFQNPIAWFIGLNVLCLMFQETTISFAFTLSKTTMSFALWF